MGYKCPVCGHKELTDFKEYVQHTEAHILEMIKKEHPQWADKDGMCGKCMEYYRRQMKGE